MGGSWRFLTTPFPTLLNHLRRPSLLYFGRLTCRRAVYGDTRLSPLLPIKCSQFHAQPINHTSTLISSSSSSCFSSHPWPEWCCLISILTCNGQPASVVVEDSFVAYQDFFDDFVHAASLCLAFARDRPKLIGSLSRRDIEVVVSNGTPFLFKAALETTRRMRAFLGIDVLDRDNANTVDLMKYILSYASKPVVSSEESSFYSRELIELSCRNLLHELVEVSFGTPAVDLSPPDQYQYSGRYSQTPRPIRQIIEMKRGDWICQKCSFMNFARNDKCLECEEPRPRRQLTGGEWECPQCDFLNYGRNLVCLRCDFGRPAEATLTTISSAYPNGNDPRSAENEKTQRWFSKVSEMDNACDMDSAATDEDFPEIMPLRKGENKFAVSTRKTPPERRLGNSQFKRNNGISEEGNTSTNNILSTSMKQNMDQISQKFIAAADENTESARGKSCAYVPFVPLLADVFDKNGTSVMEKDGFSHTHEASDQTSSASLGNYFGNYTEKLQSNRPSCEDEEREEAGKSESWFKKIAELHDVKDLPSAISDDDFPEIIPMRKGENRFSVCKQKDSSLTSPMYKRQAAMEQASNSMFVPFVPFPPGYFTKKDTQQADSSSVSNVETSSISSNLDHNGSPSSPFSKTYSNTTDVKKIHVKLDDPGRNMSTAQTPDDQFTSSTYPSTNFSGSREVPASLANGSGTINSHVSPSAGKSLEGSGVKETDPLDMSEEAKAERWFRRVAQIKDISELSQIPDEDFPSIMPMRKGINRFVVSKRKTPLERRLTSTQYRRNLPVVTSDTMERDGDNSGK